MLALTLTLLAGCAGEQLIQNKAMKRGFNALQHESTPWDSAAAGRSMDRLASLGANAVVLIAFMEQDSPDALEVRRSGAVTMGQLRQAISYARANDLHVTLKPQMLVPGSWAGAIKQPSSYEWQVWFNNYSREMIEFAIFAQQQDVDALVIGTELVHASDQVNWPRLIGQIRRIYKGEITYAAHNTDGVKRFRHWQLLDAVSLTLYPSLGRSGKPEEMQQRVMDSVEQLRLAVQDIGRPLWVMEIGIPSARGAAEKPWAWHGLKGAEVDLALQSQVLDIWLRVLDQQWVDGVFIWAWYSDSRAGGRLDTDYTPQNKPAEVVIGRYW